MPSTVSSNEILKELNISRSTFYYLLKHHLIDIPTTSTGRYVWNEDTISQLKMILKEMTTSNEMTSEPAYKTTQINNRRYLGNKYKLLDFIKSTVNNECSAINTVADIFAGTGSVASAFSEKKLITNDLLYFNHICHIAWFGAQKYDKEKIVDLICFYNTVQPDEDNYTDLKGCEYTTLPDRIEAGTYMSIIIASRGQGIIKNIFPNHLTLFTGKLLEMGAKIKLIDPNTMEVSNNQRLKAMNFITQPYPGFPTDLQALAMALLCCADGISVVTESLYENRFMHIPELWKMGANIIVNKKHAIIKGVDCLVGTQVQSTDLRAGAALVTAAVMARGETEIGALSHIDRGYENFVDKLRGLGLDVVRTNDNSKGDMIGEINGTRI